MPDLAELQAEFAQCLQTGLVTNNSPHVRNFEEKLQAYFGCPIKPSINCNGELALYHLTQAWKHKLGNGPHDSFEVLVPSLALFDRGAAGPVKMCGCLGWANGA